MIEGLLILNLAGLIFIIILMLRKKEIDITKQINDEFKLINNENILNTKDQTMQLSALLNENNLNNLKDYSENQIKQINSFNESSEKQINNINTFKVVMLEQLNTNFKELNKTLEEKLHSINNELNAQLDKNFSKTNDAFKQMIERLAKIDEAQKKIESLSTNIVSLQDILSDKKSRGTFGEVQLNNILKSIFGEANGQYKIQAKLSNGMIVDALLDVPDPVGKIAIDSKFPLENYQRMMNEDNDSSARKEFTKVFKNDLKKHIDDISKKYIIPLETSNSAILFLPAEAIFAQINAYHQDIIEYANNKRVWLTSPTTLMATLTSIQVIVQNIEQSKYAKIIQEHLLKLNDEFLRYSKRWDNLSRHLDNVSNDAKEIHTTTKKISNQFNQISNVNFIEGEDE